MKRRRFGTLDGREVEQITLESTATAVSVLSYGCTVRDWRVDGPGGTVPVVLGFPNLGDYVEHARAHGAVAGRVANRTANGRFELEGRTYQLSRNDGPNHLHGGTVGLQRRVWDMDADAGSDSVTLSYRSPDGEEGYPGTVDFEVVYRLEGPRLVCEMSGRPDRPTPINLAQHSYYNLAGGGDVRDHVLWVAASSYTPTGGDLIPEGVIRPVTDTPLDFTEPRTLADADPDRRGLDSNVVLDPDRDRAEPAARVWCPRTDLGLRLWTDQPGLQVFDAATIDVPVPGHDGQTYGPFSGLCLEPQHFPDSLHNPEWPSIIASPEAPYVQRLVTEIARG